MNLLKLSGFALAIAVPLAAGAQSYGAYGNVNATSTLILPDQPREDFNLVDSFGFTDNPQALLPHSLSRTAEVSNGGGATALFKGSVGSLKAYSSANFGYGFDALGHGLFSGYGSGSAQGSFADLVVVSGAGLALGTPVSYRVDFSIDGSLSSPSFEMGGFLEVNAGASTTLRDQQSGQEIRFDWDARKQATGLYSLSLATQVGHTLQFTGSLYTSAYVSYYAQLGRSAEADFYHSALYSLAPSVAGLNTVGASGHDFLAGNVPEPASWSLFGSGLLALLWLQRRRS
ncbi:PEP-CTERM sorting domain-containing protein [Paucibacter sp. B2R-40]|uniref:PEP-CTERM sorting domain-containing protein n=1 Tax=Paucibacter sp. B2R-40 TaxID=2893554 RepID=UPI0021E39BC6|nr:PEP-CTERM sorting domain-containing protein [Paucibacter sp. B2R-40]MCV2356312.1 PEP-CTERM sorting domain-containing protein [Paucibacter sp. B2R-40]